MIIIIIANSYTVLLCSGDTLGDFDVFTHLNLTRNIQGRYYKFGLPDGSDDKNLPALQDPGLIAGLGRFPRRRNDNPVQYS